MKRTLIFLFCGACCMAVNSAEKKNLCEIICSENFALTPGAELWSRLERLSYADYEKIQLTFDARKQYSPQKPRFFNDHQKQIISIIHEYKRQKRYDEAIKAIGVYFSLSLFSDAAYGMQETGSLLAYELFNEVVGGERTKILQLKNKLIPLTNNIYCEECVNHEGKRIISYANNILFSHFIFAIMDAQISSTNAMSTHAMFVKNINSLTKDVVISYGSSGTEMLGDRNMRFYLITTNPTHVFYADYNCAMHFGDNHKIQYDKSHTR